MPDSDNITPILTRYADRWVRLIAVAGGLTVIAAVVIVSYYFTPKYTRVGYQPTQPAPFSHEFHVGQLGMSCKYCDTDLYELPLAGQVAESVVG